MSTLVSARGSAALLVVAGVLWGTGGLAGALLGTAGGLDPVPVAAYRLLIGGFVAVAVLVVVAHGGRRGRLRDAVSAGRLLLVGGLLAEFQAAYQVAVAQISVSLATLITIGCVPVFVAAGTALRERRLPATSTLVAIAVSLVGLGLLCGAPLGGPGDLALGVIASVAAGAGFAVLTLLPSRSGLAHGVDISAGLLVGGLLLLPVALVHGMAAPLTAEVVLVAGYLGVVPTALAYGAYLVGLRYAGPVAAALATMVEPLTATLLAVGFHGERLSPVQAVGTGLIAVALGCHQRGATGGSNRSGVRRQGPVPGEKVSQ